MNTSNHNVNLKTNIVNSTPVSTPRAALFSHEPARGMLTGRLKFAPMHEQRTSNGQRNLS